jgi:acyl-CoA thioesterase-1
MVLIIFCKSIGFKLAVSKSVVAGVDSDVSIRFVSKVTVSNLVITFVSLLSVSFYRKKSATKRSGRKKSARRKNSLLTLALIASIFNPVNFALADSPSTSPAGGTILVFGDSISAAYGMDREQGWVHLLTERLATRELDYKVINASVSGETTGGGLVRLPKTLQIHQPDLVIIELGGNDGLRGYPISKIHGNLNAIVDATVDSGADILLVGMVLPPNYGARYTKAFENLFSEVADQFNLPFIPTLLQGAATDRALIQRDGIHPTPEAQNLLLEEIWPKIERILISQLTNARGTDSERGAASGTQ